MSDKSSASPLQPAREAVEQRIAQIDAELATVTQLEAERERLQEALKLLGQESSTLRTQRGRRSAASPSPGRKAAPRKARRGNTEGVVTFLRANPDAEAGAVVAQLGVSRGVIYNLLRRLVEQGTVEKSEGDNGRARYRLTAEARARPEVSA